MTSANHSPAPTAPALPTRFRFSTGFGRAAHTQGDLEAQLRQRLRFIAALFFALNTTFAVVLAILGAVSPLPGRRDLLWRIGLVIVPQAIVSGWMTWRLRPGATHDLVFLRRVELGAVAAAMITGFAVLYVDFPSLVAFLPDANISLGVYSAAVCSVGVVAYGVLIPNTWRRCAAIISALIVASLLADVTNVLRFHVPAATAMMFLLSKTAFSVAFGVPAAYGVDVTEERMGVAQRPALFCPAASSAMPRKNRASASPGSRSSACLSPCTAPRRSPFSYAM